MRRWSGDGVIKRAALWIVNNERATEGGFKPGLEEEQGFNVPWSHRRGNQSISMGQTGAQDDGGKT